MKLTLTSKRPCALRRGEARRVPQPPSPHLVGYHLACPRCGFVFTVVAGHGGMQVVEAEDGITFSEPVQCAFCRVVVHVCSGHIVLEEGPDVRSVSYR
jgi:hypothetical protein